MLDTIKSSNEISEIFSNGQKLSNKYLTIIYIDRGRFSNSSCKHDLYGRVAFIAGKKHGGAVWRNSAKRRLRELFRIYKDDFVDYDVLLVAKSTILKSPFNEVLQSFNALLKRMNNGQRK